MPSTPNASRPRRAGRALVSLLTVLMLLGVLAAWGAAARASAAAQARANPTAVAVVNLEDLINGLDQFTTMEQRIQPYVNGLQAELDTLIQQLQDKQAEIELAPAEQSELTTQLRRDFRKLEAVVGQRQQINQQLINLRIGDELSNIYDKIRATIDDVANREGYGLVVVDDRGVNIPPNMDAERVQAFISRKRILYASGEVDITERLIARMNADFQAGN